MSATASPPLRADRKEGVVSRLQREGNCAEALSLILGRVVRADQTTNIRCLNRDAHRNGDAHASLVVKPEIGRATCKVCDLDLGLLALGVRVGYGETEAEVAVKLAAHFDGAAPAPRRAPATRKDWAPWCSRARADLPEFLRSSAGRRLKPLKAALIALGVGYVPGNVEKSYPPALLFPVHGPCAPGGEQPLVGLVLRALDPEAEIKSRSLGRGGLIGLPRLQGAPDAPVILVAGERDLLNAVHTLPEFAWLSPSSGEGQDLTPFLGDLRDRNLVILYDVDEAGVRAAEKAREALSGTARSAAICRLPLSGKCGSKDLSDYLGGIEKAGKREAALRALIEKARTADAEAPVLEPSTKSPPPEAVGLGWEPPLPLEAGSTPPFPLGALPYWQQNWVQAEASATQTPPDLAAFMALSVVATAAAKTYEVELRPGYREPLNLYAAVILESGNRKSPVVRDAKAPVVQAEKEMRAEARPRIAKARANLKILEGRLKKMEAQVAGSSDPDPDLVERMNEAAIELDAHFVPAPPRFLFDDVTPEKLAEETAAQRGRGAIIEAEGGFLETQLGRYSEGPNIDFLLKAYSGESYRVLRVRRGPVSVDCPALTIGLAVQKVVLEQAVGKRGVRERGLLARFLYSVPVSLMGRRQTAPPAVPSEMTRVYESKIAGLIDRGRSRSGDDAALIRLSAAARSTFDAFTAEVEPELSEFGHLGHVQDWGGKIVGNVGRVAGLLHLATYAESRNPESTPVAEATMAGAVEIGRYCVEHALRVFGAMKADPVLEDAHYLMRLLRKRGVAEFRLRELQRGCQRRFPRQDDLLPALALLAELGWIRRKPSSEPRKRGAQPSPEFEMNPRAYVSFVSFGDSASGDTLDPATTGV